MIPPIHLRLLTPTQNPPHQVLFLKKLHLLAPSSKLSLQFFSLHTSPLTIQDSQTPSHAPQIPPSWLTQTTTLPSYLYEYHVGIPLPTRNVPSSNLALFKAIGVTYPLSDVLSYDKLSSNTMPSLFLFQQKKNQHSLHKQFVNLNDALIYNKSLQLSRLMAHSLFRHYSQG